MKTFATHRSCRTMLLFMCLAFIAVPALAVVDNAGILDNVLARYSAAAGTWAVVVTARASWLFWTLVIISMVWTFGMMAMRKADLGEFFAEFVRFTIFTGFFWWLLVNGPAFAMSLINSLRQIGTESTGLGSGLAPSGVVDIGFDIFFKVLDQSSVWSPVDSACGITISAIILVVFALVGVNMLLLLISSWILAYAGVFFLGFGGSRWTSEMAIGYFRAVLNIAGQLFAMVLLVGIGKSFVDQYYAGMSAGLSLKELGIMLVVAVVLLALVRTIPGLIGGLAGGNTGSLGSGFGAGAALGAAAMGAAAIATAGAAVAAGATSVAGGAQALMSAYSKASAAESSGGGTQTALTDTSSMPNSNAASSGGTVGGGSTLAAAMGDTGQTASSSDTSQATGSSRQGGSGHQASTNSGPADTFDTAATGSNSSSGRASTASGSSGGTSQGTPASSVYPSSKAGRIAAATVVNLARGTWNVAKAKAATTKESAMSRIAETTGGKIAAAIEAYNPASRSGEDTSKFGDDSLAKGSSSRDADDEVAAFRDRQS
jgi:type IV secretion system protein TrbL